MAVVFTQPIEQFPAHLKFSSTPTVTNVDASYPAANLLTYDPTQTCRVTTNSTVITWDFGSSRAFHVVALLASNVSYRAQITVEGSLNGSSWTTLQATKTFWAQIAGGDAGAGPFAESADPRRNGMERNHSWYYSATELNYRYVRLTVSDPVVTGLTFGRLWVGRAFTPTQGLQYGSGFTFDDSGVKERTDQGAMVMIDGRRWVTANVKMDFVSDNEFYDYLYQFNYWRGSCREMVVCLDTTVTTRLQQNIIYGTITEGRKIVAEQFNAWSQTWNIEAL